MMNYFSSSLLTLLFVTLQMAPVVAQNDLPEAVQSTIDQLFPDAEHVDWESDGEDNTVYFIDDGNNVEITFQEDGNWIQITTYLEFDDLPAAAKTYINDEYDGQDEFTSILKMETKSNVRYYVNFEVEMQIVSLAFDEKGKLLERQVEEIDEDDRF